MDRSFCPESFFFYRNRTLSSHSVCSLFFRVTRFLLLGQSRLSVHRDYVLSRYLLTFSVLLFSSVSRRSIRFSIVLHSVPNEINIGSHRDFRARLSFAFSPTLLSLSLSSQKAKGELNRSDLTITGYTVLPRQFSQLKFSFLPFRSSLLLPSLPPTLLPSLSPTLYFPSPFPLSLFQRNQPF